MIATANKSEDIALWTLERRQEVCGEGGVSWLYVEDCKHIVSTFPK